MTTHTISSSPRLSIFPNHRLNPINRLIYSGFLEHMGRCIYGGIYDPSNSTSDLIDSKTGFRLDVIEALKPLNIPCFRYPGGNFCATYHWQDGIGPRESRPARTDLAWGNHEPNAIGTDEFMVWCKDIMHAEPYLCLNFGTGTLDEALAWLEYCNGTQDTYWANMRRKNGHAEPYNVIYWALGNEMWGDWQVCQLSDAAYAEKAFQWAKALKLLDPSIKLVLCGKEGNNSWDHNVLKHCIRSRPKSDLGGPPPPPLIDMHSIHLYTASKDHYENCIAPLTGERAIETTSCLIDLCYYEKNIPSSQPRPLICFDEWNVWLPTRAPGQLGAEENYTLSDALAVGVWLNILVRKSADLGMANIAQSVNVLSPLMTTKDGIIKQTIWWPYELFCKYMNGELIAVHLACELYNGPTKMEEWGRSDFVRAIGRKTPWMDVSATVDEDSWVSVCVVNMHLERDMETEMEGTNGEVQVFTVTGESKDATNMNGKQEVGLQESKWDGKGNFTFPKCSLTMLRWKV